MTKLYRVTTTVPKFMGHKDVELHWFVQERDVPAKRPYAELVSDYDSARRYEGEAERAIDEMFDEAEAAAFVAWLKVNRDAGSNATTTTSEVEVPIPSNSGSAGSIPLGGFDRDGNYEVEAPGLKAAAWFLLSRHEQIDSTPAPEGDGARRDMPGSRVDDDEVIRVARMMLAVDAGTGSAEEFERALEALGQRDHVMMLLAYKLQQLKPYRISTDNPETIRRARSVARRLGGVEASVETDGPVTNIVFGPGAAR